MAQEKDLGPFGTKETMSFDESISIKALARAGYCSVGKNQTQEREDKLYRTPRRHDRDYSGKWILTVRVRERQKQRPNPLPFSIVMTIFKESCCIFITIYLASIAFLSHLLSFLRVLE